MQLRAGVTWRSEAINRIEGRARTAYRKVFCYSLALSPSAEPSGDRATVAVRASKVLPFARTIRQHVRHRPGIRSLGPGSLLMGAQGGQDACAFASAVGTLRYGSVPMQDSPHVRLLRAAMDTQRELSDDEIRRSEYWGFAQSVRAVAGGWFGANSDEELLEVTRNFIDWGLGRTTRVTAASGSPFDDNILVAAVADSMMFQVIDGHHRVAAAIARQDPVVRAHCTWLRTETPLQRSLRESTAARQLGRTVLRQPIPAREVEVGWTVTQNCADRLIRMTRFLEAEGITGASGSTYLDVASSYGWFLGEMKRSGFSVLGIESDSSARDVGTSFYGLGADEVLVGDLLEQIEGLTSPFDVVSSFALTEACSGDASRQAVARQIKSLDRITGAVLFVDGDVPPPPQPSGVLPEAHSLTRVLIENTSFRRVVDLGENRDGQAGVDAPSRSRLLAFVR